jgi:hypothetical protein
VVEIWGIPYNIQSIFFKKKLSLALLTYKKFKAPRKPFLNGRLAWLTKPRNTWPRFFFLFNFGIYN